MDIKKIITECINEQEDAVSKWDRWKQGNLSYHEYTFRITFYRASTDSNIGGTKQDKSNIDVWYPFIQKVNGITIIPDQKVIRLAYTSIAEEGLPIYGNTKAECLEYILDLANTNELHVIEMNDNWEFIREY